MKMRSMTFLGHSLLSAQRRVQSVEIFEYGDVSQRPSAHMLFEQMGFGRPLAEFSSARQDTSIVAGKIKAGTLAAQRFIIAVHSGGEEVVRLDQYAYVTKDVDPAWDIRNVGWRVRVNGDAPFDADLTWPIPASEIGDFVPAYNANLPVNAIPYVCAAPPGILTAEDLPPIVPRGPRPKKQ